MNILKIGCTIVSLNFKAMYTSITYTMVWKENEFISKNLSKEEKDTIEDCLEMIKFGIGNIFIVFIDEFYGYGGEADVKDRGLTIWGYQ